jgi:hypothetical protein
MKNIGKNIILLLAIGAIALMIVGIFVYNYIPTDITIAKASTYEVSSETTKILSDAADSSNVLGQITGSSSSSSGSTSTTIVLQTYEITKSDLKIYKNTGAYQSGKSDPFADVQQSSSEDETSTTTSSSGVTGSQSGSTTGNVSDGTLFNSTSQK